MSEKGRERRESGRATIQLPVEYDRLNALLSDYTHNISRGGTFIRTERPLETGSLLAFTVRAPELGEPLQFRGLVRWVVLPAQASEDRPAGMGIEFVFDSQTQKEALEARLDRLMVESLGPLVYEQLMGKPAPPQDGAS